MKDTKYRTFEIPRANDHVPFKFAVHTSEDGAVQVTRISPYDETEYHWASKSAGRNFWSIIRSSRKVSTIGPFIGRKPVKASEALSPEQIAYFLIEADQEANLEPRICHN